MAATMAEAAMKTARLASLSEYMATASVVTKASA